MKAIVKTRSGSADHLKLQDVDRPVPKDDQLLVRVHVATVTIGDVKLRNLNPFFRFMMLLFGFPSMRIPGVEMAGELELGEAAREERRPTFEHIESYEVLEVLKMDFEQALFVDLIECRTREGVSIHDLERIGNMEVLSVVRSEGERHACLVRGREEGETGDNYGELDLDLIYTTPSFQSVDRIVLSFIGAEANLRRFVAMLREAPIGRITNLTFKRAAYQRRDLLSVLTDRQREVLVAAYRSGYYDLPKRIGSERLSDRVGISKPTMLEHLRKAEGRLLSEIMAGYPE